MAAIADIYVKVLADLKNFEKDLTTQTSKAADKAGKDSGKKFGTAMSAGVKVFAAGAAVLFGAAAKGAIEMENAVARFRAETGATAEEAENAADAMNRLARNNLQDFEEVSDVLINVTKNLGLEGDAAEAAADQMLNFSTATGQDASDAVEAFDDVLDAFGLNASSLGGVMDQIVASTQEYGGSVEEAEAALKGMAPALSAMNSGVDEGIGLINLLRDAGLDASVAQRGLNTAVKNLPPGTSLREVVDNLRAIENPAMRAQEAIRIFGSRAGVGISNAMRDGTKAFDDYILTMDETAGATVEAGDAIEGTLQNQVKRALNDVKGALRDFGDAFGAPLMAIASLASLSGAMIGPLKGLAATLIPTATVSGTAVGTAWGAAFQVGAAIGIAAGAFVALKAFGDEAVKAMEDPETTSAFEAMDAFQQTYHGPAAQAGRKIGAHLSGEIIKATRGGIDAGSPAMVQGGAHMTEAVAEGVESGKPEVKAAAKASVYDPLNDMAWRTVLAVGKKADQIGPTIHDSVQEGKSTVKDAMADLMWALKHPFEERNYRDWLARKMTEANRARNRALKSGNQEAIREADRTVGLILAEYHRLNTLDMNISVVTTTYNGRRNTGGSRSGPAPRAFGGPVWADNPYLVGERGPELFMPTSNGQIVPNIDLGSGSISGRIEVHVTGATGENAYQVGRGIGSFLNDYRRETGLPVEVD